jgi:hypothetical protein
MSNRNYSLLWPPVRMVGSPPSIQQQIAGWTTAGYTPAEARSFVAFRELGLVPEGQRLPNRNRRLAFAALY